jgi:outer membrane protein assembly factor BamD
MNRRFVRLALLVALLAAYPFRSPAPLIYRPGEGWTYEAVGSESKWRQLRAKEQLAVAQTAFDKKDYSLALKAAKRVTKVWPLSDYAPQAQYLTARCYEAKGLDQKAFKAYQTLLEKYPKLDNFQEVLRRQVAIADKFLAGKWFRLWNYIPLYPSMEKTANLYDQIVKSGPYSDVGPQAQLKIGAARDKQKNYPLAAKAYETAADRYSDRPEVAAEALYREGQAEHKQAKTAEYDQNSAAEAIAVFTDFMALYPNDPRVKETGKIIADLKTEQARGNFQVAKFYEKYHKWKGALVYYNEVIFVDPNSPYAPIARERIDTIKKKHPQTETASK